MLKAGAVIVIVMALAAIVGPSVTPFDPAQQELPLRLAGPTWRHPFGLDELGRDILARVLAGARISFFVALVVVSVSAGIGTMLGAVAGYFGGALDDVISRVTDTLLAFPGLLLAIALVAVLGPSLGNVLFALTIIGWVGYAQAGPRSGAARARIRVRAGRPGTRRPHVPHAAPSHRPQRHPGGRRAGDARHGGRDSRGSRVELPRAGSAAADAKLGDDAQRRAGASAGRPSPHVVSRPGDRPARAGVQFRGRRTCGIWWIRSGDEVRAGGAGRAGRAGRCYRSGAPVRPDARGPPALPAPPALPGPALRASSSSAAFSGSFSSPRAIVAAAAGWSPARSCATASDSSSRTSVSEAALARCSHSTAVALSSS